MIPLADLPYLEWTDPDTGAVSRLYADVIKHESANLGAVISKHAVEQGANITDHYRKDNETVSVTYYFSGSPIRGDLDPDFPGTQQTKKLTYQASAASGPPIFTPGGLTGAVTGLVTNALGLGPPERPTHLDVLAFDSPPKQRIQKALEIVRMLQSRGILVTVKTTFGPFENVGILSAQVERAPEDGDGSNLAFELEQLRSVSSDLALALPLPEEPRAIPKKTASAAGGTAVGAGTQKSSVLKGLLNNAGVTNAGSGI